MSEEEEVIGQCPECGQTHLLTKEMQALNETSMEMQKFTGGNLAACIMSNLKETFVAMRLTHEEQGRCIGMINALTDLEGTPLGKHCVPAKRKGFRKGRMAAVKFLEQRERMIEAAGKCEPPEEEA